MYIHFSAVYVSPLYFRLAWAGLGASLGRPGGPVGQFGASVDQFGLPLGRLGPAVERLGSPVGRLGAPMGGMRPPVGCQWACLWHHLGHEGRTDTPNEAQRYHGGP